LEHRDVRGDFQRLGPVVIVGVPKESKIGEYRVSLVPESVRELSKHGHQVLVECSAGEGIRAPDAAYAEAGAEVVSSAAEVFERAALVVKVKEPQSDEIAMLRPGQGLFTYLHLAPDVAQTDGLIASRCTAIAYETVTDSSGSLPLLTPMSEIAGRLSVTAGARCLQRAVGGAGILLGGVSGTPPAKVVVIGAGTVGTEAVRMAVGLLADVTVLDTSLHALRRITDQFGNRVKALRASDEVTHAHVRDADLVIGAVLVAGDEAPKLVDAATVREMRRGSAIVDVAIDQGGCFETSRPTTHTEPTYFVDGVVHYCVTNMPGCVPRTSSYALNHATLDFVLALADRGLDDALRSDPHLLAGLNIIDGRLTHPSVAHAQQREFTDPHELLGV
jgi:alanine dehydrogenase